MSLAFEGRGPGKANLAELCCYWGYSTPLPRELWFPINIFLLALTFSFPGSDILFRLVRSWVVAFVTLLRSLPGSKHLTVALNSPPSLESVILFEKPVLGPLHGC